MVWSDPAEPAKTAAGERTISLDLVTVAALRARKLAQLEDRAAAGGAWQARCLDDRGRDRGPLVLTRPDGAMVRPECGWRRCGAAPAPWACRPWTCTGCGTPTPPQPKCAGVQLEVLSKRLGHADEANTLTLYRHVDQVDDRQAAEPAAAFVLGRRADIAHPADDSQGRGWPGGLTRFPRRPHARFDRPAGYAVVRAAR